jgi:hypothetical protein
MFDNYLISKLLELREARSGCVPMSTEALIKSFDRPRMNGKCLIPFVVDCMDAGVRATQEQLPRVFRTTCAPEGMSGINLFSATPANAIH